MVSERILSEIAWKFARGEATPEAIMVALTASPDANRVRMRLYMSGELKVLICQHVVPRVPASARDMQ